MKRSSAAISLAKRTPRLVAAFALALALAVAPVALAGCSSGETQQADAPATDQAAEEPAAAAITVQVTVDSSAADGSVSYDEAVELEEGATVLDAIQATGLDVVVEDSSYGAYVDAIGGLATGDHGSASGWTYTVNDEMVMDSADTCELADGDTVAWSYMV